jgi:hypothetical protein
MAGYGYVQKLLLVCNNKFSFEVWYVAKVHAD